MRGADDWGTERRPLEETAFHRIATDNEEGSLSDVAWAIYFSLLAILVIANPADWPAGSILAVIGLSAVVAVCRRRRIGLTLRALSARRRAAASERDLAGVDEARTPARTSTGGTPVAQVPSILGAPGREPRTGAGVSGASEGREGDRERHTTT